LNIWLLLAAVVVVLVTIRLVPAAVVVLAVCVQELSLFLFPPITLLP
jgi:hypothetical protein